jgi:hypothetical protein
LFFRFETLSFDLNFLTLLVPIDLDNFISFLKSAFYEQNLKFVRVFLVMTVFWIHSYLGLGANLFRT